MVLRKEVTESTWEFVSPHLQELVPRHLSRIPFDHAILVDRQTYIIRCAAHTKTARVRMFCQGLVTRLFSGEVTEINMPSA